MSKYVQEYEVLHVLCQEELADNNGIIRTRNSKKDRQRKR